MSLSEVQARTAELSVRLRALAGGPRGAAGPLGAAAVAATAPAASAARTARPGGTSFAETLQAARTPVFPGVPAAARTAAAGTPVFPGVPAAARAAATSSDGASLGTRAVEVASRALGTPYVWGGESPGGFDCSGLIQWTYAQLGIDLPRVSRDQARAGREVSAAEARPGDLVFFDRARTDHIGIYAGDGRWVVAPRTGDVVQVQDVDLAAATTIRRVVPDGPGAVAPAAVPRAVASVAGPGAVAPGAAASGAVAPAPGARSLGDLGGLPAAGRRWAGLVQQAAQREGIPPALLAAVAWTESGFDPAARSPAGAQGLVQLMPRTARSLGVDDPLDPAQSLAGGARYLRQQLDAFGRVDHALAAYNAGPTAVRRHGGIPPYEETQDYVTRVLDRFRTLGGTT